MEMMEMIREIMSGYEKKRSIETLMDSRSRGDADVSA